jgi:hypothetical protein
MAMISLNRWVESDGCGDGSQRAAAVGDGRRRRRALGTDGRNRASTCHRRRTPQSPCRSLHAPSTSQYPGQLLVTTSGSSISTPGNA